MREEVLLRAGRAVHPGPGRRRVPGGPGVRQPGPVRVLDARRRRARCGRGPARGQAPGAGRMALSHRPGDQLAPGQIRRRGRHIPATTASAGSFDGAPGTAQGSTTARPSSCDGTGAAGAGGVAGTAAEEFEAQRPRLFGLAYRLLGSAVDAEDVVQDAYLRWQGADPSSIAAPRAWLAKVVTNLSLNRLASARAQRERYAGPWLPEPVLTEGGALGPPEDVTQRESVSLALLVLLERLTPAERAVFVLREAFGYSHGETAQILELSEANCRQLQRRARDRIAQERPRFRPEPGHWRSLADRFLAAARAGDLGSLERMLAADVTAWTDGGGKVTAARRPVAGRARVARYLAGGIGKFGAGARAVPAEVNGEPAIVGISGGTVVGVLVLEVSGGEIGAVRAVANPDKLRFAARQVMGLSHLEFLPGLS